jgi:methyl-accepting chemotaxis protein
VIDAISETMSRVAALSTSTAAAIEEQSAAAGEISRNVAQAAAATKSIAANISGVAAAAAGTSNGAARAQEAARAMASMATELRELLASFRLAGSAATGATEVVSHEEKRMDFDEAIKAHSAWKQKLAAYLKKPDASLNPAEVQADERCKLGKWIYGDGAAHSGAAEFAKVKSDHMAFHRAAAAVVRKADSGQSVSEDTALGGTSDFAAASSAVVFGLMQLRSKVNAARV